MGTINTIKFIVQHPLNKRRQFKAIRHWLTWQIGSRLVPGPVAISFVNDTMLLVAAGMTGATGNIYAGLHEFQDMAFLLHLLRKGDMFVDVGANVGSYTVLAGGIGAKCISVEPTKSAFNHLMRNIQLNGIGNVVDARNIAIGSKKGILKFTSGLDTVNHVVIDAEANSITNSEVEVDTLDNVIAESEPVLIKIDVEGFETEVVVGAESVLAKKSLLAVIMELNGSGQRYNYDDEKLYEFMLSRGFIPCLYIPFTRSLEVLSGQSELVGNTLFVKDLEAVRQRLRMAPTFTVRGESI